MHTRHTHTDTYEKVISQEDPAASNHRLRG